jgi:PAS domain S-box-containing protein
MCIAVSMIPIGIIGGINGFQSTSIVLIALIILVTFVVSIFISYFITQSIEKLTDNIDAISKGELDVQLESSEIYEINNLTKSLNRIMASLKLAVVKVGVKKDEIFENNVDNTKVFEKGEINKTWNERNIDPVFTFDENANVVDCNENMYNMLGYTKGEMLGLNISDFDALETKEDIIKKIEKIKSQGPISFKTIHKRKDGTSVLVEQNIQYLNGQNKFKCVVRQDNKIK